MVKVGILGGGQLGRMLLQASANYPVETHVLENDPDCPAAHLCHKFTKGDIKSFDDVYKFGKELDVLTIEIESVNEDALLKLEQEGKKIFPSPGALKTIKNKVTQKQFYKDHQIPTSEFVITNTAGEISNHSGMLPAVHKIGMGGYDGRGIQVIKSPDDFQKGFDGPSVLEKMVPIQKEISQIVAINSKGETALYPPVHMVFDPDLNLLDYQISPAELPEKTLWKVEAIALTVVKALRSPGIFAIELFVNHDGDVFVNETAPRVHNSGHHTIEANFSSQFDMLWRVMLEYPLGNTDHIMPASIVNLIGAPGYSGEAVYDGLNEVLHMDNAFVHIYGKKETKPGRKMGHVTILSNERQDLSYKAHKIKQALKVISK
ncbi:MAG: 5-(carboxyamino)imidazole ribonucleotide synthase [Bacteroidetes bacterium]|nr:MAG: 5-(carboxyamino)imidazole ribonucleotide synthase [Bacteroidota bacterium]